MPLKSLFRKPKPKSAGKLPPGRRVYAIGDIHGRLDCLDRMLAMIVDDMSGHEPAETSLIYLGDYVDRGPDSCGVVDRVMQWSHPGLDIVALKGNHEEILLSAAANERSSLALFDRVGGRETMLSYGMAPDEYDHCSLAELAARIGRYVPQEHLTFLAGLQDHVTIGHYRFVHAGVRPGIAFDEQKASDLRWIRGEFLNHDGPHDGIIVHGHTVTSEPVIRANRIGIDTGAFASGVLTALVLDADGQRIMATEPPAAGLDG